LRGRNMADGTWRRFFLTPTGEAAKAWRLPVLLRGRRKRRMLLLIALGLAQSALSVVIALSVREAFDELVGVHAGDTAGLRTAGIALAALTLGAVLRWREFLEAERLAQSYIHAVRVQVFRHAMRLGEAGMAQTSRSALLLRFTGDMTPLRLWISRGLSRGVVAVTSIVVTLIVLLVVAPFIGLTIAASLALTGLAAFALGPALDRSTRKVRRRRTRMLKHAQERLQQLHVIETVGDSTGERRVLARKSDALARASIARAGLIGVLRSIGEAGAAAASIGALLIGAMLAGLAMATPGAVVAAMLLAGLLSPKMQDLTRAFEYWTSARISIEKQARFLALRPVGRRKGTTKASKRMREATGHLTLANVSYGDQVPGVTLSLSPGDRIWLGNTTGPEALAILRLAAGVLQPTRGRVGLDGVDLRNIHRRDVRRHVALVSADFDFFEASLRANLIYGVSEERAAGLETLIAAYGLGDMIAALPGGLEHVVRTVDRRFAGGNRLVFGLIRARLSGARIILVDQSDLTLGDTERAIIERLLADHDGAVLWTSHTAPQGYREVQSATREAI
jgi:ABC-type multidrug transport system fused ATPase/permease subunit